MFEWENEFEQHILERGWRYAQSGAVKHLIRKDGGFEGVVAGSEYYKVDLQFDGHFVIKAYCSCPYAAGGNMCKHMAAVLYEAFSGNDREDVQHPSEFEKKAVTIEQTGIRLIADIIRDADRSKLEELLLEYANNDDRAEAHIRSVLSEADSTTDISDLKAGVDNIFSSYAGRGGYIDYYSALSFAADLDTYLRSQTDRLLDDRRITDAFELTIYAFVQLGNCDIDDDGEISEISNTCYSIWQRIIAKCSAEEQARVKKWFITHSEDGTVIDYMEDVLKDFLKYELASEEELQAEMADLDRLIEESGKSNKCKSVFTQHYGYAIEAIELRMILMKKLGAREEEIDEFRRRHLHFLSVRKYYLKKSQEEGDTEEEIRLLRESKELDSDSSYLVHTYSERLISLYHMRNETELEKAERLEDFLLNQMATVEDFRAYREMSSEEEWLQERNRLIESRRDVEKRCEFLAEEKMIPELYEVISNADQRLSLINKYGFLLAAQYSEHILEMYRDHVKVLAENARNRSSYDELTRYLMRMQQYRGGNEMVRSLCLEWMGKYPTRKVMMRELSRFI